MDRTEFEWQGAPDGDQEGSPAKGGTDRLRGMARPSIGLIVVLLLAVFLIGTLPQGTMAHTTFTAGDVSVTTNSGRLTSLTVAPDGDVHYDGLESEPSSIELVVYARLNSSSTWENVISQSVAGSGLEGSVTYSFAEVDLLTETSMTSADFSASDGETEETDVSVKVEATLVGAGPSGGNVTASSMDTMTISVTNQEAGAGVGGQANSDGSGA